MGRSGAPVGKHLGQEWNNVYLLMDSPKPARLRSDEILQERKTDAKGMVVYGEAFFYVAGIRAAPEDLLGAITVHQPADRDVVCHAARGHRFEK